MDSQRECKRQERERIQEAAEMAQRKRAQDLKNYQMMEEQRKRAVREKKMEQELKELDEQISDGHKNEHNWISQEGRKNGAQNKDFSFIGLRRKLDVDEDMADSDEEQI
eukprot:TRINITY_DN1660_c0_g1_i4.p4 TRINITY_DN1660_c0_g1~~TRINITY_DN1660_c0_g1_i4.p4  ORF type:complete len:109 (-),score=27.48 TRINITY_DN1660_c0_g1_i4:390-716(-)